VKGPVSGDLKIGGLRDIAWVYANNSRLGVIERRLKQDTLKVSLAGGETRLRIIVENLGRVNFGREFGLERKGIDGKVTLNGAELSGWHVGSLPLADLRGLKFSNRISPGPTFYRGFVSVETPRDTYLDMTGWGHGFVWVNGKNLGRYWSIGAQQSLFLPGVWMKKGRNEVTVLDMEEGGNRSLSGVAGPVWRKF
jgi:beta-galactosidase